MTNNAQQHNKQVKTPINNPPQTREYLGHAGKIIFVSFSY